MINLLLSEQAAELERDEMQKRVQDSLERKRLEKIFGIERAKSQTKI